MGERPRRVPLWKIAALFFGALALIVLTFWLWVESVADRKWKAMERRVQELLLEAKARDARRPVLRGEAVPGNAWDDYGLALAEIKKIGKRTVLSEFASRPSRGDRTAVENILAQHSVALDHLRRGARRAEGQSPYLELALQSNTIPGMLDTQWLANFSACQARLWTEAGRAREAAELLLDTCQFGRDVGHNGVLISEMIGIAVYGVSLEELREVLISKQLTKEDFLEVERELEILDGSFVAHASALLNDVLSTGVSYERGTPTLFDQKEFQDRNPRPEETWRYFFSTRLLQGEAFDRLDRWMRRASEAEAKPWAAAQREYDDLRARARTSYNILLTSQSGVFDSGYSGRSRRADLRLLRVAAHYLAAGEILELDDPFGVKLRHSVTDGKLKLWSVGRDGQDDGGDGVWMRYNGKDIVLEIPK